MQYKAEFYITECKDSGKLLPPYLIWRSMRCHSRIFRLQGNIQSPFPRIVRKIEFVLVFLCVGIIKQVYNISNSFYSCASRRFTKDEKEKSPPWRVCLWR